MKEFIRTILEGLFMMNPRLKRVYVRSERRDRY